MFYLFSRYLIYNYSVYTLRRTIRMNMFAGKGAGKHKISTMIFELLLFTNLSMKLRNNWNKRKSDTNSEPEIDVRMKFQTDNDTRSE